MQIVQDFINETIKKISEGNEMAFTSKAQNELEEMSLDYEITTDDIEFAILNLRVEDYFRGIDPSGSADYYVCAFCTKVGADNIEIYLKYGLEANGLKILIFSNHPPQYPMNSPFKN